MCDYRQAPLVNLIRIIAKVDEIGRVGPDCRFSSETPPLAELEVQAVDGGLETVSIAR
jgi:hypothetical protein